MTPHDALFKTVFGQPEHARSLLRMVLPPALTALIDWSRFQVHPNEFVDPALRTTRADLVVQTFVGEQAVALQLLLEHQSTPDEGMPLRFVAYMEPTWRQARTEAPGADLVPLIPVVIHHGAPWRTGTRFRALYGLTPELEAQLSPWLLDFGLIRVDLGQYPDAQLFAMADAVAALAWLALVVSREGDLHRLFHAARNLWLRVTRAASGGDAARAVFRYIMEVRPADEREAVKVAAVAALAGKEKGKMAQTIAEWYREEGFREGLEEGIEQGLEKGIEQGLEKGIEQGLEKGIEKGIEQGVRRVFELQLRLKFGALPADFETRAASANAAQWEAWTLRILTAASLDEVFAPPGPLDAPRPHG